MMRFVDLFAGTGGIRLGFEQACVSSGIRTECVYSCEIDRKACESYRLNFGQDAYADIREANNLPDFDFLLAGFPCQSFSYAGKQRGFGDTRGTLFFEVERLLKRHQPTHFLLENVRGLTTHDKGRTFRTIEERLHALGYHTQVKLLNSCHFGVPQNRVRIYIVGSRKEPVRSSLRSDTGPADSHSYRRAGQASLLNSGPRTLVRDILQSRVEEKYLCSPDFVNRLQRIVGKDLSSLHGYRLIDYRGGNAIHSWELGLKGQCSAEEVEFMNLLIANRRKKLFGSHQDGKALTVDQIKTFYKRDDLERVLNTLKGKGYISCNEGRYNPVAGNMSFEVFKFLDPESISITLTASDANRLGVVQNGVARRITPRECARLQGFPDSYELLEDDAAMYKQMGNAVSVPVIRAVVEDLIKQNPAQFAESELAAGLEVELAS